MEREKVDRKERAYYELGIVILLALLWCLVMVNRLAIVYLFPFIIPEFKISYAQAGGLASILAITTAFGTGFSEEFLTVLAGKLFSFQERFFSRPCRGFRA